MRYFRNILIFGGHKGGRIYENIDKADFWIQALRIRLK